MSRVRVGLAVLLLVAPALAGCASDSEAPALTTLAMGTLEGTVVDASLAPLPGAVVSVDGANATTTADATGLFRLVVPPGEYLVLATAAGHRGGALRAAPGPGETAKLQFMLAALPTLSPDVQVQEGHGLLSCGGAFFVGEQEEHLACGSQDPNQRTSVEFTAGSLHGLEGAVVEVVWEPTTQAATMLGISVWSTSGEGEEFLAYGEMASPAALTIPGRVLAENVSPGRPLRVEVTPTGSLTDEEANLDAGLALQQPFAVYVSMFYHQPPPAGYSVLQAS